MACRYLRPHWRNACTRGKGGGKATAQGASLSLAQMAAFSPMGSTFSAQPSLLCCFALDRHTRRSAKSINIDSLAHTPCRRTATPDCMYKTQTPQDTDRRTWTWTKGQTGAMLGDAMLHWHRCKPAIGIQKRTGRGPRDRLSRLLHTRLLPPRVASVSG